MDILLYVLAGLFAGFMSGVLGIGGGILVVPALVIIFQHAAFIPPDLIAQTAAGCSLAIMVFTSLSSIQAHIKRGNILWAWYNQLWLGLVIGTGIGVLLADCIPTTWLELLLGIFLLLIATKLFFKLGVSHTVRHAKPWVNRLASVFIGMQSGLLGIGGGSLMVPYLAHYGLEMRKITALSALSTLTAAIVGTIGFILTGLNEVKLPPYSTGYIYWPAVMWVAIPSSLIAPFAVKFAHIIPPKQLTYGFIIILLITAANLLF